MLPYYPYYKEDACVTNTFDKTCVATMQVNRVKDDSVYELVYRREIDGARADVPVVGVYGVPVWVYFVSQEDCYVMNYRQFDGRYSYNLSLFGVLIHEDYEFPTPFLWHIDLKTGVRNPVAWLNEDGEVLYDIHGAN